MSVNSRRWELTGAQKPPVLVEYDAGRPSADEVLVEIDGCTLWCGTPAYSFGSLHSRPEQSPEPRYWVCGHVVEAGANALYFTDRAVIVPVVVSERQDAACWFSAAMLRSIKETSSHEIDGGCTDCIIVPARELCLVERDDPVSSSSIRAFFPGAMSEREERTRR